MRKLPRPYWSLWTASTASNLGDGVVLAALPLLAASLSQDPVAVSGVTIAAFMPWLLFGLLAGVVVDRVNRRLIMWTADVGRAVVVGLLAAAVMTDRASLWLIYAVVLLLGIGETLFDTAAQTVLPAIVETDQLESANGLLFGAQITANGFAGPPLGGLLFAAAVAAPFAVDAATFVVSAVLVGRLRGSLDVVRERKTTVLADVREGLSYLWRHRIIRAFAIGAAVINLGHAAEFSVIVLYAQQDMGLSDVGFGLLLAASAAGGIAGTVLAARVTRAIGRTAAVLASVAIAAASMAAVGLTAVPLLVGVALFAFAFVSEVWNVVAVSYRQAAVPDAVLGRVMAGYRVIAYGAFPLGALLGGVLAKAMDLEAAFFFAGAVIAGLLVYLTPILRGADLRPVRSG